MSPHDLATRCAGIRLNVMPAWTASLPSTHGVYELWDPTLGVHMFVRVFCAKGGCLAVRNPCGCVSAFDLAMWKSPLFHAAYWRGPIEVPWDLPPSDTIPAQDRTLCTSPHRDAATGKPPCLLGVLCP